LTKTEKIGGEVEVTEINDTINACAANYALKLSRPGFGPRLKPVVQPYRGGVTPLAVCHSVLRTSLVASGVPLELRHLSPGHAASRVIR